jgi:hypothetical protein
MRTDDLWEMAYMVAIIEAAEKPAAKRGPCRKGIAQD